MHQDEQIEQGTPVLSPSHSTRSPLCLPARPMHLMSLLDGKVNLHVKKGLWMKKRGLSFQKGGLGAKRGFGGGDAWPSS